MFDKRLKCILWSAETVRTFAFPDTVEEVREETFADCSQLRGVTLSRGLERLEEPTFRCCVNLKAVRVRGNYLFSIRKCIPQTKISHTGDVRVGTGLLRDIQGLRQVVIPNKTRKIMSYWFAYTDVETVMVPETVREFGEEAFRCCRRLESIVLAPGGRLEKIGPNCFKSSTLREISLGQRLKEVGEGAFECCANLKQISLPERVERIGARAFRRSGLTRVQIPAGLVALERGVFSNCQALWKVTFQEGARLMTVNCDCFRDSGVREVSFPAGVRGVLPGAFDGCDKLQLVSVENGCQARISWSGLPATARVCPLL